MTVEIRREFHLSDFTAGDVPGNLKGFLPTILVSGTRDLILSQTVLFHCKLRQAGVTADLHLMEGASHFTYFVDPFAPESQHIFVQMSLFFDAHLGS